MAPQLRHRQLRPESRPLRRRRHLQRQGAQSPYRSAHSRRHSNTIGIVEASGCFPGYPALDPLTGTLPSYMTWHWPAYPNSFGPYWPDPDQLPGQANYTGLYILAANRRQAR